LFLEINRTIVYFRALVARYSPLFTRPLVTCTSIPPFSAHSFSRPLNRLAGFPSRQACVTRQRLLTPTEKLPFRRQFLSRTLAFPVAIPRSQLPLIQGLVSPPSSLLPWTIILVVISHLSFFGRWFHFTLHNAHPTVFNRNSPSS